MANVFLKAEWRKLIMANYAVDARVLQPYLPYKTEIDLWNNTCYVSLIGFRFINTKMLGMRIPFHVHFEEINLRFYVRYHDQGEWKRGVVFVKEIVPRPAITIVANTLYGENYETMPTRHTWEKKGQELTVHYEWKKKEWNSFKVVADAHPVDIASGSEEEFITEHYWGYTRLNDTLTSEYGVEHPRWQVYPMKEYAIEVDFENVYGSEFAFLQSQTPRSVFLAEGSEIMVRGGRKIR